MKVLFPLADSVRGIPAPSCLISILKESESLLLQAKPIPLVLTVVTRKSETGPGPAGRSEGLDKNLPPGNKRDLTSPNVCTEIQ